MENHIKVMLMLGGFVIVIAGIVGYYGAQEEDPTRVSIWRYQGGDQPRNLSDEGLRSGAPGLAEALDTMIREGSRGEGYPLNDETRQWCRFLDEALDDCSTPFFYRDVAFRVSIVDQ